jgi:hypothetical protein
MEGPLYGAYPVVTRKQHSADPQVRPKLCTRRKRHHLTVRFGVAHQLPSLLPGKQDFPLPPAFKVDPTNASAVAQALAPLLTEPPHAAFEPMVRHTLSLPSAFGAAINHIFSSAALHIEARLSCPEEQAVPLISSVLVHLPLARITLLLPDQASVTALSGTAEWQSLVDWGYTDSDGGMARHAVRARSASEGTPASWEPMRLQLTVGPGSKLLLLGNEDLLFRAPSVAANDPRCGGRVAILHHGVVEEQTLIVDDGDGGPAMSRCTFNTDDLVALLVGDDRA